MKKLMILMLFSLSSLFIFNVSKVKAYTPPQEGEVYKVLNSDYISYWTLSDTYINNNNETINLYEIWIDLPNYTDDWVVFNNVFTINTSSLVENIMISYRIVGLGFNSFNYITSMDYLNTTLTSGVYAKVTSDSNAFLKVDKVNQGVNYLSQVNYKYYTNRSDVKVIIFSTIKEQTPQNVDDLISYLSSTGLDNLYFYKGFVVDFYTSNKDEAYADGYRQGKYDGYNSGLYDGYEQGYRDGTLDGDSDLYDKAYQLGYSDGYEDGILITEPEAYQQGYKDGSNESFLANFDKWIVPAIIVIMLLGGYFAVRRQKQEEL